VSEPLALEAYVLVLAHLLKRRDEPIATVLGALNVSGEAFKLAEEYWSNELEQSLPRRKGMMAMKFASAFAEARKRVGLIDPVTPGNYAERRPQVEVQVPTFLKQAAAAPSAWAARAPEPQHAAPPIAAPPIAAPPIAAPPIAAPRASPVPPPPGPPPAARKISAAFSGTAYLDPAAPVATPMPFTKGAASSEIAKSDPSTQARRGVGTGTAFLEGPEASPAPARQPADQELTLEQYATLVIALSRRPPNPEQLLARYGIMNADQQRRVDEAMKAQLARDPALRAQYHAIVARLLAQR
jgi:hypothetical protein